MLTINLLGPVERAKAKFSGSLPSNKRNARHPGTTITLTAERIAQFKQPMVYVWWLGSHALYVGSSANGIARPFSNDHHVPAAYMEADRCELHICATGQDALRLEHELIDLLKPRLNKQA